MLIDFLIKGTTNLVLFGIIIIFRKLFHKEGIDSFLININSQGKKLFIEGSFIGMSSMVIYALAVTLLGEGKIFFDLASINIVFEVLIGLIFLFFAVALFEEGLFRGYILQRLYKKYSIYLSIGVPAIIFGLIHYFDYSHSPFVWIGVINAIIIAIILSIIVIKTHSLMFVLGFHFFWNFTQNIFLSNQINKVNMLVNLEINEGFWSGTIRLPEGGMVIMLILLTIALYVYLRFIITEKS